MSKGRTQITRDNCRDTRFVTRVINDHDDRLTERRGKGDHVIITDSVTGQHVTRVDEREMSPGVGRQLYNFFQMIGIVVVAVCVMTAVLMLIAALSYIPT
jgi:hypothetical protein